MRIYFVVVKSLKLLVPGSRYLGNLPEKIGRKITEFHKLTERCEGTLLLLGNVLKKI